MRKLLSATLALGTVVAAAPAFAQVYVGADRGGVGIGVGPVEFGVGPRYDPYWRDGDRYAYDSECRVTRERIETPSGRVIFRTHRECD
jgi:hypothetical protein